MAEIDEIVQFLRPDSRFDLKRFASMTISQLAGTDDGKELLQDKIEVLKSILLLTEDSEINTAKDAMLCLLNISAEEAGATALLKHSDLFIVPAMVKHIVNKGNLQADLACGVLANLSRSVNLCPAVLDQIKETPTKLEGLVDILIQIQYNKRGAKLHLLAHLITNLSQLPEGRRFLLDKNNHILEKLLPLIQLADSVGKRRAIVGAVHNCCFDKEHHSWLLGEEVELAVRLVQPLAGPDTFTLEETESLPLDLQFLPDDKKRETEPEIRRLLLETLMQLCQTQSSRKILRDQNIYLILREHHKCEDDKHCLMLNEDVVNLLVRTEDEIGAEDLTSLSVPTDLIGKFAKMDEAYLADPESPPSKSITELCNKSEGTMFTS